MNKKILVAYASCTGSTAEVAEKIGKNLEASGVEVDVCEVGEITTVSEYQAVVLGSAVQAQKWLPEAVRFVDTFQRELAQKPCAMFTLCMTLAMKNGEKYRADIESWLEPVRRKLNPVSEGLFAGVLDISKIPSFSERLKFRMSVLFGVWKAGDNRDWDAIQKWIDGLPGLLDS